MEIIVNAMEENFIRENVMKVSGKHYIIEDAIVVTEKVVKTINSETIHPC